MAPRTFRRSSLWFVSLVCLLACLTNQRVFAQAETEKRRFDVSEGYAINTLKEAAQQAEVEFIFSADLVKGVRTSSIQGMYAPLEAFSLMLAETSLEVLQHQKTGVYAIAKVSDMQIPKSEPKPIDETKMNAKKNNWLTTLAAVLTLGVVTGQPEISAQEETEGSIVELEKFVVTGYRASLLRASEMKKNADQVLDAVSAEDIGKLPDPTVADALQRITGIQLTRQDNEGREVSVRGLSSFFTKVTMNGVGIVPGAASDDSDGLDVGLLPADLISSLEVFKSPTAKQVEGGVGGTVNIRTARPLELDRHSLYTGRLRMNYESLEGSMTPDASFQIARVINEDFGILFGVQHSNRKYRRDAYHDDRSGGFRTDFGDVNGDGENDLNPEKTRTRYNQRENDATTYNLTLQWQPHDDLNFTFDAMVSDKDRFRQFGQNEVRWRDMDDALVRAEVDENNTVVEAEFSEVVVRTRDRVRIDPEQLDIFNFGAEYKISDRLSSTATVSYTENTSQEFTRGDAEIRRSSIVLPEGQTFGYRLSGGDAGFSFINEGGFAFNDPNLFSLSNPDSSPRFADGGSFDLYHHEQATAQIDFTYEMEGFLQDIEFGTRWFDRDEARNRPGHRFTGEIEDVLSVYRNLKTTPSDYGDTLGIDGFDPFVYPDSREAYKIATDAGLWEPTLDRTDRLFEDNYTAATEALAGYAQGNFSGVMSTVPYRGNFGIRFVDTDFQSTGVKVINDRDFTADVFLQELVTEGNSYAEALPSANIAFNVTDNTIFRVALARVMKRPRPEDTRAAFNIDGIEFEEDGSITPDTEPYEAFNGNPELDPFVADQIDVSLEYYSDDGGTLSAGYFYKKVKDLTAFDTDFNVADIEIRNPMTQQLETVRVSLSSPINLDGTIKGFELSATQFFEFLPAPLDGLGLQANFTYTDAEDENGNVVGGTSEQVYNVIGFYEKKNLGIRLAYNFRDKFNDSPNRGITGRWTDAHNRLDLSAFYKLNDQLMITLEGINLTDEGYRSFLDGFENRINTYEQTGTRWLAGIRFKY